MTILGIGILTWITFLPLAGMIAVMFLREVRPNAVRWTALSVAMVQLLLAAIVFFRFDRVLQGINSEAGMQFMEKASWIDISGGSFFGRVHIDYFIGIDGVSVPMVLLTAIICVVAVVSSWKIGKSVKGYFALILMLDTGMMGVFVALDFFLFYVFWELMLLPMYFLVGIWGGPRREYAAIKFFLYTLLGSVLMLLAIIALYASVAVPDPVTGEKIHTFNMIAMMNPDNIIPGSLLDSVSGQWRILAFLSLFIGFAIKVPIVPFHTWLPDAHVEAPTPISVILAGVLLKTGTYGMLRVNFAMFPDIVSSYAWFIGLIGVINMVYGALVAMAQTDFKKMIAYSSVSHMGVVILGMASLGTVGITGAVLQMFNHGTITAMLFLIVGVIYDRTHTRGMDDFGGLMARMPWYGALTTIAFFAGLGLPGLSAFISEAFSLLGAFMAFKWLAIAATASIVLTAGYMLWAMQRIFLGTLPERWSGLRDLDSRELTMLVPLAVIVVVLGVYPAPMLSILSSSTNHLAGILQSVSNSVSAVVH